MGVTTEVRSLAYQPGVIGRDALHSPATNLASAAISAQTRSSIVRTASLAQASKVRPLPTHARVRELLNYEPSTGALTWRVNRPGAKAGRVVGCVSVYGYRQLTVDAKPLYAHRVAWMHFYGEWPKEQIDHINGDRLDNRLTNLRDVSGAVNSANKHKPRGRSGLLGAHVDTEFGGFASKIGPAGAQRFLGRFKTAEEAHYAYMTARAEGHTRVHAESLYGSRPNVAEFPSSANSADRIVPNPEGSTCLR